MTISNPLHIDRADLLIENGTIVTMDAGNRIIPGGAVAVEAGRIKALGPTGQFVQWQIAQILNARGGLILPGLINTHTHAAMALFRGLADDLP